MRSLHQVAASQLGIGVWYQKGFEKMVFCLFDQIITAHRRLSGRNVQIVIRLCG